MLRSSARPVLRLVYALRPVAKVVAVKRDKAINAVPGSIVVLAEYEMDLKGEFSGRIVRSELDPGQACETGRFSRPDRYERTPTAD